MCLVVLVGCQSPSTPANTIDIVEYSATNVDLPKLVSQRIRTGKTPILYFYADWCGPCRRYRESLPDPALQAALSKATLVKINIDTDSIYSSLYNIQAVPTFVKIDSAGNVLAQITSDEWNEDVPEAIAPVMRGLAEGHTYDSRTQ
ncbi:thioredoxin domain-containing protein [Hymenobacter pini]|uniref:thioredoxin domain-containing protein n=1 Tax=Hymenobacter pini TaxID=2880879 RepID=UPI001CF1A847|nr:thioredoxin family protein [Hymenobacter pini]